MKVPKELRLFLNELAEQLKMDSKALELAERLIKRPAPNRGGYVRHRPGGSRRQNDKDLRTTGLNHNIPPHCWGGFYRKNRYDDIILHIGSVY